MGQIVCMYKKNINMLEIGLDEPKFLPMYLDAIAIARGLKVDYLWIDSLCINQQDKNDPLDLGV